MRAIEDVFDRHVAGSDPFRIEALFRTVQMRGYTGRPDVSLIGVLSGIEMACWDIVGKAVGKPAYELLGGRVHERLRAYTYLYPEPGDTVDVYMDPDLAAERAAAYVDKGFTAVKFDPVGPYSAFDPRQPSLEALARTETYVARVREAVGDRCDLLIGTHGQLTPPERSGSRSGSSASTRCGSRSPCRRTAPSRWRRSRARRRYPCHWRAPDDEARVLPGSRRGAAAILQPNLGRVGGLLEAKKIAGMAEAHYAQIAPHLYCGPIVGAANIQLAACTPNFLVLEGILDWGGFHAELLTTPLRWEDGFRLSRRPSRASGSSWTRRSRPDIPTTETTCTSSRSTHPSWADADRLRRRRAPGRAPRDEPLNGGFDVVVHDRDDEAVRRLAAAGASTAGSPAEAAAQADTVITCLPAPAVVAARRRGRRRCARRHCAHGATWIDMSTNDRNELLRLAALAREHGVATLEAPVTGGVHLAASGDITVIVGGDEAVLDAQRPLLEAMGRRIFHVGALGSASDLKVITNMLAFVHLVACGEALMLAKRSALDLGQAYEVIAAARGRASSTRRRDA